VMVSGGWPGPDTRRDTSAFLACQKRSAKSWVKWRSA
jgi:hypothetical protein